MIPNYTEGWNKHHPDSRFCGIFYGLERMPEEIVVLTWMPRYLVKHYLGVSVRAFLGGRGETFERTNWVKQSSLMWVESAWTKEKCGVKQDSLSLSLLLFLFSWRTLIKVSHLDKSSPRVLLAGVPFHQSWVGWEQEAEIIDVFFFFAPRNDYRQGTPQGWGRKKFPKNP